MRYFKSSITIENGQKKYGNLPIGFVQGYENNDLNEVYFILRRSVNIPDYIGLTEITKEEYDNHVETVNQLNNTKKQVELNETIKIVEQKQQRINDLETSNSISLDYLVDIDFRLSLVEIGLL